MLWKVIKLVYFVQRMLTLLEEKLKYLRRHTHRHVYNEEKDQLGNTFTWTKCALKTVKEYKKDACPQLSIWFQFRSKASLLTFVSFSTNQASKEVIHTIHRNIDVLSCCVIYKEVIRFFVLWYLVECSTT